MAGCEAKLFIKMFCFWQLFVFGELDDRNIMFFGIKSRFIKHPASICIRVLPIKVSDGMKKEISS